MRWFKVIDFECDALKFTLSNVMLFRLLGFAPPNHLGVDVAVKTAWERAIMPPTMKKARNLIGFSTGGTMSHRATWQALPMRGPDIVGEIYSA